MGLCVPSIFRHTQVSPLDTWVIPHNLGSNGSTGLPIVDVFIIDNGTISKIIPLSVSKTNANVVTITFSDPTAGEAVIIV
jgi:hypothetical protein